MNNTQGETVQPTDISLRDLCYMDYICPGIWQILNSYSGSFFKNVLSIYSMYWETNKAKASLSGNSQTGGRNGQVKSSCNT